MGLLDFIFGNKKKEEELLRKQQEAEHLRKLAQERAKQEEQKKKEAERLAKQPGMSSARSKSSNNSLGLKALVDKCVQYESKGDIVSLQDSLFQLYQNFNKPNGGKLIINYPDKVNLSLCFAFMLRYDWMHDNDIREVWAEDGFYCIMDYIAHQSDGRQGQAEGMMILFTLLCVGRDELKPKINNILQKGKRLGNPIFHADDYRIGAQNVIDQFSLLAVSGARDLGPVGGKVMQNICLKFDGLDFFGNTIKRKDLMKYSPMDVFAKAKFIHDVIESILAEM